MLDKCSNCGQPVKPDDAYCATCGLATNASLNTGPTPETGSAPVQVAPGGTTVSQVDSGAPFSAFERVVRFLENDKWPIKKGDDKTYLFCNFRGENGRWLFSASFHESDITTFYSEADVTVPADKMEPVMEFITRANDGLFLGNFELDMDDRLVKFKTSLAYDSIEELTQGLIGRAVYINVNTMDQYLPGIMSVIYGNVTPKEAIAKAEEKTA